MNVTIHPARMVQPVQMNLMATHASALTSGLAPTVQVY